MSVSLSYCTCAGTSQVLVLEVLAEIFPCLLFLSFVSFSCHHDHYITTSTLHTYGLCEPLSLKLRHFILINSSRPQLPSKSTPIDVRCSSRARYSSHHSRMPTRLPRQHTLFRKRAPVLNPQDLSTIVTVSAKVYSQSAHATCSRTMPRVTGVGRATPRRMSQSSSPSRDPDAHRGSRLNHSDPQRKGLSRKQQVQDIHLCLTSCQGSA